MVPVTVTIPDPLVDAITERRGTDALFDELAALIDTGFHYSAITYPNPRHHCTCGNTDIVGIHNFNGDPCIPNGGGL